MANYDKKNNMNQPFLTAQPVPQAQVAYPTLPPQQAGGGYVPPGGGYMPQAPVGAVQVVPTSFGGKPLPPLATVVTEENRPGCNDGIWALLFLGNVAAVVAVAGTIGRSALHDLEVPDTAPPASPDGDALTPKEVKELLIATGGLALLAIIISFGMIRMMLRHGEGMIHCMLYVFYAQIALAAAGALAMGSMMMGGILLLCLACSVCAFRNIQSRIRFAAVNLKIACLAVRKHVSIVWLAVVKKLIATVWVGVWAIAFLGVYDKYTTIVTNADGTKTVTADGSFVGLTIALFFALVWGKMVLAYAMHCTTAGTVASWWFQPQETSAVGPSLGRTMTTSFGSVSLAGLIIAFLETVSTVLRMIKDNDSDNAAVRILACLAECLLNCIENLIRYFNKYAIAYCGIYGDSFCEAGGKVRNLFTQNFWDAIANENLIDWAFSLCCLAAAAVCAAAGAGAGVLLDSSGHMSMFLAVVGGILGYFFMYMQCSILTSAVVTVYICFAENKQALEINHPALYQELTTAWEEKYPGCLIWFGGGALGGFGI